MTKSRRVRLRHGLTAALLLLAGFAIPGRADADTGTILVVAKTAACSDSGPATVATPFCTLQHALDVVNPGDTIAANGIFPAVTMTRSGTPSAPITIARLGYVVSGAASNFYVGDQAADVRPAFTFSGVHDVQAFQMSMGGNDSEPGVLLSDSHDVTFTQERLSAGNAAVALEVDGTSSNISVYRTSLNDGESDGVHIDSGASNIVLSTNNVNARHVGIAANGAQHVSITSNTIWTQGGNGVTLTGGSNATLENNVLTTISYTNAPGVGIVVAADSLSTVHVDYNAMDSRGGGADYMWGGKAYVTPAAFTAATGQGVHDVNAPGGLAEGSPAVDSADVNAVGELSIDYTNRPRRDDPLVANTGAGSSTYYDRGAVELQDSISFPAQPSPPPAGVVPWTYAAPAATSAWGEPLTVTTNYGDGSAPVTSTGTAPPHTYTATGTYYVSAMATDTDGTVGYTPTEWVVAATPSASQLSIAAALQQESPTTYDLDTLQFTFSLPDSFEAYGNTLVDFGDGSTPQLAYDGMTHSYFQPGYYTVSVSRTDVLGRISTASTVVAAGLGFAARTPIRDYDTRQAKKQIPGHGTLQLSADQLHATGAAVVLNTTVTNAAQSGYLVVYPGGTNRPNASVENFAAHQTVANQSTDLINGTLNFYNASAGPIDLIVDTFGSQAVGPSLASYKPIGPTRALDTRGGAAVAGGGTATVDVAAVGVPADAQDVVLNITTTNTHSSGYLSAYAPGSTTTTSVSNWASGQTVANLVVVPVAGGKVTLKNYGSGTVNFIADVAGYYSVRTTPDQTVYMPVAPTRIMDTRTGAGVAGHVAQLAPGQTIKLMISGKSGVPVSGVTAAALNLTATAAKGGGFLVVYPDGTTRPTASSLNFVGSASVANASTMPIGADGAIDIHNGGNYSVDVIVDLEGTYFAYPTG